MRVREWVPLRWSAAVGGVLSSVPDSWGRVVLPARYRRLPAEQPEVTPLPDGPRRILIGSLNTAGQAHRWAQALNQMPGVVARSVSRVKSEFTFEVDYAVPLGLALVSRDWQREHFRVRGLSATDVVIESGVPFFGPAFGHHLVREVRALQENGIRVAIVCHGSDVRSFRALNARNPYSPYALPQYSATLRAMERRSAEARRVIRATGVPVLGSTQGVLIDMPGATWLPVVVNLADWETTSAPLTLEGLPLVVHAPSQASIKGSDVVDEVVGSLVDEGLVRYERLAGVTHDDVRDAYHRADIMIDSLRMGGYGAAACEAMAAGRVVVSNVFAAYREDLRERYAEELPVVQADPGTLDAVLRDILADRPSAREIAARGPSYVARFHDGRESARVLLAALDQSEPSLGRG